MEKPHRRSGRVGNIMSSGISNLLPSVLEVRPALQDGQWVISMDVTRSECGAETTTPQQLKPGIARVTNPEEYVQRGRSGRGFAEHMALLF